METNLDDLMGTARSYQPRSKANAFSTTQIVLTIVTVAAGTLMVLYVIHKNHEIMMGEIKKHLEKPPAKKIKEIVV